MFCNHNKKEESWNELRIRELDTEIKKDHEERITALEQKRCEHCYCQTVSVSTILHWKCCNCGHQQSQTEALPKTGTSARE